MKRNYFLILAYAALACLFLIFFALWWQVEAPLVRAPVIPAPNAPFKSYITGVGIVEPSGENILISTPLSRIVEKVLVNVGSKVKKGEVIIRLEDRDLKANLLVEQAAYQSALSKLQKLEAFPRPEDLATATAAVRSAQVELDLARQQNEMVQKLADPRAISQEDRNKRASAYQMAEANFQKAQAELDKIKSGTWKPDLEIARNAVQQAQANVNRIEIEIQRTAILSPIDGNVLQVKVNEGEIASLDNKTPMMILGNTDQLYLRVNINQLEIPYFKPEARAVAYPQGDSRIEFPLEFVRVEPFLVNKTSLTNRITEKVDTRVLQILYHIKTNDHRVYVEQQMDVFIEAKTPHETKDAKE